jgi:hypothetical protein
MQRTAIRLYLDLLLLITAATCCGCSFSARAIYIDEEKKSAERAIEKLHGRLNAEEYQAIYDDAHDGLKRTGSKDAVTSAMKHTRDGMGKIVQVTEHWISYVKGDPIPIRAIYNIKCEKGDFSELIAYAMDAHGEALLVQYQSFHGTSPPPPND